MAGIQDCVKKVVKASEGEIKPEEAQKMIEMVVQQKDAGITQGELFENLLKVTDPKAIEQKKLIKKFNEVKSIELRKHAVNRIEARLQEAALDTTLGKIMRSLGFDDSYSRIREGVLYYYRSLEAYHNVVRNDFIQHVDTELKLAGLMDYATDIRNDTKIIQEMANLNRDGAASVTSKSVTGDEQAFKTAKLYRDTLKTLFDRKIANGSTIAFKKGFITSNMWSENLVSQMSNDKFVELISKTQDAQKRGLTRSQILEIKNKVGSRNYVDPDDLDAPLQSDFSRVTSNLAELSGASRAINLTTEEYIELAPLLFDGENLFERINLQIERDASTVAKLETLGANPRNQLKRIMETVKENTKDLPDAYKRGKHALDSNFYLGDKREDGTLTKMLMGDLQRSANSGSLLAQSSEALRDMKAATSLGGSAITAQQDIVTAAIYAQRLQGDNANSIAENMFSLYQKETQQFGKVQADNQLKAELAGVTTYYDALRQANRYDNRSEQIMAEGLIGKVRKGARAVSKLNQLENLTNLHQRANYIMISNITHSHKDIAFENLDQEIKTLFTDSGVTAKEWDLIRQNAATKDHYGNELLTVQKINSLDLDTLKELFPQATSTASLRRQRDLLASKWNSVLWRATKTGVLMPDIVDQARASFGTQRGTFLGEFMRHATLFKTFSFGFTARILVPMLKRSTLISAAEQSAALLTMGMGIFWAKDILSGKKPRDFANPSEVLSLVSFTSGMPYVDSVTWALTSDNPNDSNLIPEFVVGPALTDVGEGLSRFILAGKAATQGKDPDVLKRVARTFMPYSPTRNMPLLSIGHNIVYNKVMDNLDPGYLRKYKKRNEKRGVELMYNL